MKETNKPKDPKSEASESVKWSYPPPPLNLEEVFQNNEELIRIFCRLQEVIARELSLSENHITPTATFYGDLRGDSLDVVKLFMVIEDEFDIDVIPEEEIEKMETVEDVVNYIEKETTSTPSPIPASS